MRKIDRIFVATHREDLRLTRICIASIRHWYPDLPIFLLKDEGAGSFSTREIEELWNVKLWPTRKIPFGWGFIKLEPLFDEAGSRYLVLDSDIVFIGRVVEELERFDADFVVHEERQSDAAMRELYFDVVALRERVDPAFTSVPFTFNTGQYVATSGLLTREDFATVVEWTEPPRVRHPHVFNASEQGVLNYLLLKRSNDGVLSVEGTHFMMWGEAQMRSLDLSAIATNSPYPSLIHWAGLKKAYLSDMLRSDILRFFERKYYDKVPGGRVRLAVRVLTANLERTSKRMKRRGRRLLFGPPITSQRGS